MFAGVRGRSGAASGPVSEFLVGLEDVSGEVGGDWIGLVFLAASNSAADRARPGWRACRAVCAGCAHRDLRRVEFMAAVQRKPAMASSRSVPICGWAGLAGLPSWELVV